MSASADLPRKVVIDAESSRAGLDAVEALGPVGSDDAGLASRQAGRRGRGAAGAGAIDALHHDPLLGPDVVGDRLDEAPVGTAKIHHGNVGRRGGARLPIRSLWHSGSRGGQREGGGSDPDLHIQ